MQAISWRGPRLVGAASLALGTAALVATTRIPSARDGWAVGGPRTLPLVAAGALVVLSIVFLARTVVRPDLDLARDAAREAAVTHWPTPGLVLGGLVAYVLALPALGYALATAVFFTGCARVLGSDRLRRHAAAGLLLGAATSWVFTRLLGVRLPVGPWGV